MALCTRFSINNWTNDIAISGASRGTVEPHCWSPSSWWNNLGGVISDSSRKAWLVPAAPTVSSGAFFSPALSPPPLLSFRSAQRQTFGLAVLKMFRNLFCAKRLYNCWETQGNVMKGFISTWRNKINRLMRSFASHAGDIVSTCHWAHLKRARDQNHVSGHTYVGVRTAVCVAHS